RRRPPRRGRLPPAGRPRVDQGPRRARARAGVQPQQPAGARVVAGLRRRLAMHGVLVIDKPAGMTSAAAVECGRGALRIDRAGHGGTLDPIATGVLPVCVGAATELAQFLLADDKAYEAEGVLGVETDTLDRTGAVTRERSVDVSRDGLL